MLDILLEVIQMEAGIQQPILEDTRPLQYIEWGWIPSIRDFLYHMDAQITNATSGLPLYRENDSLIMDSTTIKELSRKEQILVNRCRIFLQIENLSDITNAEGKQILSQYINNHPTKPSRSRKKWPLQGDPGREAWNIWKRVISRAFLNANDELLKPLGAWTKQNMTRNYEAYWSQTEAALIQQHGKHSCALTHESNPRDGRTTIQDDIDCCRIFPKMRPRWTS
jgi:hypothetical protein